MPLIYDTQQLHSALESAHPDDTLELAPGDFRLKAMISTPGLSLRGAGADLTRILWDDYATKLDDQGREFNTFRTWTLAVCADDVSLSDLAVVNDALYPERKGQEVALTVYADGFSAQHCRLSSTQDTLFLGPLPRDLIARYDGFLPDCLRRDMPCRQQFTDCLIEGTVDFIFGCGETIFQNCEIRSLLDARGSGYTAAPAHEPEQSQGFTFQSCRFTAAPGVQNGSIFLARPWRDYGLCHFLNCSYGPHISPLGFDKWNDTHRDQTARFYEDPPVSGRVPWTKPIR